MKYEDNNNLEILYLLGICSFHLENYEQTIKYFNEVLIRDDGYRRNVFFFLAIAYKRINNISSAL